MAARMGPLLRDALARRERGASGVSTRSLGTDDDPLALDVRLPVIVQFRRQTNAKETWRAYSERIANVLGDVGARVQKEFGGDAQVLRASASLGVEVPAEAIPFLRSDLDARVVELDAEVFHGLMDDAKVDVHLDEYRRAADPDLRGAGVRVAVLDNGVDAEHPHLEVAESISACSETADIPGAHGTHCGGIVASRHPVYSGIAPDCTLISIKVMRANGSGGRPSYLDRGIQAALDRDVHVISLSLGANHLPTTSHNGHGWSCRRGDCVACKAADTAVQKGAVVVAAAGNDHGRVARLRDAGRGDEVDTELNCPGQSRGAVTVGALTKATFHVDGDSSRGPTADGRKKPDVATAGVNVTSTVPVPRDANGAPVLTTPSGQLFARASGTSMATPIVAGAAALAIEARLRAGLPAGPAEIRKFLTSTACVGMPQPRNVVGFGRLRLPAPQPGPGGVA